MSQSQQLSLVDLVPKRWFATADASSVWIAGFRVARPRGMDVGPVRVDLGEAIAIISSGQLSYFDAGTLSANQSDAGGVGLEAKGARLTTTNVGTWLVLATPFEVDGQSGNELRARERISAAAGLCSAFCGRNSVADQLFDNIASVGGGSVSAFSSVAKNLNVFPDADFEPKRLELLARAGEAIQALPEATRNRTRLSLHWYESALRSDGIDAFLKSWIALEVLAMPDGTNIRPINEALASAYGKSVESATKRFGVGRLFGIRSRIVHDGELIAIHYVLESYVQAIYSDVLCEHLGLPTQGDAEALHDAHESVLMGLLHP